MRFTTFAALTIAATLGAGCATPGRIVVESPSIAGCRTTIAPDADGPAQPVRWIRPESADERATLDTWCRAVGPAVVASRPQRPAPAASLSDLTVISWNVNVGAGDIARLVESLRDGTLTGQPVTRFVLLLQEAFRQGPDVPHGPLPGSQSASARQPRVANGERQDIVSVAGRLGLAFAYVPSMRNGSPLETDEDRGNAILSTEPLSNVSALELPFERQRRVAVEATVSGADLDGTPWSLRLTNVHLDNRAPARRIWLFSIATRLRQARGLLLALPKDGPAVVGGDFNTWYGFDDPVFEELATAFDAKIPDDRRATFAGLLRLDHIFFRLPGDKQTTTTRLEKFGSDHHPLLATIRQAPGGRPRP